MDHRRRWLEMSPSKIRKHNSFSHKCIFTHHLFRQAISRAVLDNYYFPMAALKVFLDIFYLTRLLSAKSLLAGCVFSLFSMFLSKRLAQRHQVLQRKHNVAQRSTTALLTEVLRSLHQIRLSSLEGFMRRRMLASMTEEQACNWKAAVALGKLNFVSSLGPVLLASVAISVHALEVGHLSPAAAFTALSFFANLGGVFTQLPAKAATLHRSWLSSVELQMYLQQPDQIKSAVATDQVLLENASISWPSAPGAHPKLAFTLTDVTLHFPRHKLSIITGKVGSGKSLILAALLDEASITSGRLGKPNVENMSEHGVIPGSTAYVSQPPWIDNCTVMDNIVFGYAFNRERYDRVLTACALGPDLAALGDGDKTIAGASGSALSGGQKWRVALARAFYSPAEILILEDVLGAVDTPIAAWICENVLTGEMAAGRTIILATHRPEVCLAAASYAVNVASGTAVGKLQVPVPLRKFESDADISEMHTERVGEKSNHDPPAAKMAVASAEEDQDSRSASQLIMTYIQSAGPRLYALGVFITLCYQGLSAGHIWFLRRWTTATATDEATSQQTTTIRNVLLYLSLSVTSTISIALQALVFTTVGMAASRSLHERVIQRVLQATLLWIDSTPFGRLFQIVDVDMHVLDNLIAPAFNGILGTAIQLGVIITVRFAQTKHRRWLLKLLANKNLVYTRIRTQL